MTLWMVRAGTTSLVVVAMMTGSAGNAYAIGDSGGCSRDGEYTDKLAFGSVSEVETLIASRASRYLEYLVREKKASFQNDPVALKKWQEDFRNKLIFDSVYCSHGERPLVHAVNNGNLEVVQWLLDMGVDPGARTGTGSSAQSIFTRCKFGYQPRRPDGLTAEQVSLRVLEAYRMLLARGVDINDPDPFHSTYGCTSGDMHSMLRQLGARVTPRAFESWVGAARPGGGRVSESTWAVVQGLAKGNDFDFRGTKFEYRRLSLAAYRSNQPDLEHVIELTRRLSNIVRLSPGVVPGQPAKQADVPGNFSPIREMCYFPEISAYPNFQLAALFRRAELNEPDLKVRENAEIIVGKTEAPIILALRSDRLRPTSWVIRQTKEAHILGVVVLDNYDNEGRGGDTLSFDPARPAYLGRGTLCHVNFRWVDNGDGGRRAELLVDASAGPSPYNPFILRGAPPLTTFSGKQFVVGAVAPSSVLISWPESIRTQEAAIKKQLQRD